MHIDTEVLYHPSAHSAPNKGIHAGEWRGSPDDWFFSAMVVLMLGMVFLGFARTYYLAGVYHTHVRSILIQVHGAVFSAWLVLLVTQTALVARRRIAIHRNLGILGAFLAIAMVGLGVAAATDSMSRGFAPAGFPFGPLTFYAVPILNILVFAALIAAALWMRSNGPAHKRLMLLATISLMGPAINRWPFAVIAQSHILTNVIIDFLVILLASFDIWTIRRIHRATLQGGVFLAVLLHATIPIGITPVRASVII